jgi:hypothetical protein
MGQVFCFASISEELLFPTMKIRFLSNYKGKCCNAHVRYLTFSSQSRASTLSEWLESRQANRIGHPVKHHYHRKFHPQLRRSNVHNITQHARSLLQLHNRNIVGCVVCELRRLILLNNRIGVNHPAPACLNPARILGPALHAIQAWIELVLLAPVAILQQQFPLPAPLPERTAFFCDNR